MQEGKVQLKHRPYELVVEKSVMSFSNKKHVKLSKLTD